VKTTSPLKLPDSPGIVKSSKNHSVLVVWRVQNLSTRAWPAGPRIRAVILGANLGSRITPNARPIAACKPHELGARHHQHSIRYCDWPGGRYSPSLAASGSLRAASYFAQTQWQGKPYHWAWPKNY